MNDLLTVAEASEWTSHRYRREITKANISYLITYGRVGSVIQNGAVLVYRSELQKYYDEESASRRRAMQQLEKDINLRLSFDEYRESERTKHVHRLHPYKGKFIPQLVEYFLDAQTDEYKREVYFQPGDIVLDPFCGSGTTLVQACELGLHALGFDISEFNTLISNTKIRQHNLSQLIEHIEKITHELMSFYDEFGLREFDNELSERLSRFNAEHFPSPEFKLRVRRKQVNANEYGTDKAREFEFIFRQLVAKYDVNLDISGESFLERWYLPSIRAEIAVIADQIKEIDDIKLSDTLWLMLSRTIRSARATTHLDLATLRDPVTSTYYCRKHFKICKPLFTLTVWWKRYTQDALQRFAQFDRLRTDTLQVALTGDSRDIPVLKLLDVKKPELAGLVRKQKVAGIFSSPPYVGMIDYHEQHAYAYELMGIERNDYSEIGPMFRGKGRKARDSYAIGISRVLRHCTQFMVEDYNVFLVANDKFGLYEEIADRSRMRIANQYRRPVLRRSENDKSPYSETIFHLRPA